MRNSQTKTQPSTSARPPSTSLASTSAERNEGRIKAVECGTNGLRRFELSFNALINSAQPFQLWRGGSRSELRTYPHFLKQLAP